MSSERLSALSIGTLKAILFQNHVNARLIIEKSDLVAKVLALVDEERRDREREAEIKRREEEEITRRQREEEERRAGSGGDGQNSADGSKPSLTPRAQEMASTLERTGLCVICQDEEANIAIVDCGYVVDLGPSPLLSSAHKLLSL
jgi:hypothetical protein